ncbi:50S ribosomal protein L31 [candidate division WWE3 bacterium RIFCSPLOWO2_01_FULL_53_14]|uniref:Large ribosomal subunit protein bL31 n=1 Tax=candidate division WWE3 bacterium RIFCSPLOWO2_01_FULL_53_14 TaxID=1802628 RepID=A0A1F4VRH6_UNCKA|nr:MAG: 50S ribosomal protein L31 [candidate division WWE3 bacterium RIFCSPLOWO2_01_FULL_53_14]
MPKKEIHPQYYPEAKVTCSSCKTVFNIGSTQPELTVEVCANCHPFYTGKEVIMDTEGRVEKFEKKRVAGEAGRKVREAKRAAAEPAEGQKRPLSLKDLLEKS